MKNVEYRGSCGGWTDGLVPVETGGDGRQVAEQVFETIGAAGNAVPRAGDIADLLSPEYFTQTSASTIRLRTKPSEGGALRQQVSHLAGVILACAEKAGLKLRESEVVYRAAA